MLPFPEDDVLAILEPQAAIECEKKKTLNLVS
jgi:hypothetical protein